MTNAERIEKMTQLEAEIDSGIVSFNEAYQTEKFKEANEIREALDKNVGEYTSLAQKKAFDECNEDPEGAMMAAVKRLTFDTIRIKEIPAKDGGVFHITKEAVSKPIDLIKLDKHCAGIGANREWFHIAQKMNFLLTAKTAKDLGITDLKAINDSYAMSEIAAVFDMGKDPTSKTNLLRTLNTVISAMLGEEYKALSHDVNFLIKVYCKKGKKALSVNCANHRYFVGYLAEICHRIVTGGTYSVEYKAKK